MQSATGQYGTQAGEPAQPVQHSVMMASSFGRFFRGVAIPSDFGSILTTAVGIRLDYDITRRIGPNSAETCHAIVDLIAPGSTCKWDRPPGLSEILEEC
jgi:hypothetical protein